MMNDPAEIRAEQRTEWARVAPRWRVPDLSAEPPPVHQRLLVMADVRQGERALDLACGTGSAALLRRLGPEGVYLGLDLSPEMIAIGQHWAERQGLRRATFRVIAGETALAVPPGSFDVATCICGLMYMPEPVAALRALHAALAPGGRIAVCTWANPERCPFISVPIEIIRRHVSHPMLDLAGHHPFAIPTTESLANLLAAAGFTAIETVYAERPADPCSPEQYWDYMEATGWPLAFLPAIAPPVREALRADTLRTLSAMFPDGVVRLGGEAVLGVATRSTEE
jgi:SAM-dependent methyltransferase